MSPRIRSVLILLTTLFVGMVFGALLNGFLHMHRFREAGRMMRPGGFVQMMEDAIQPKEESQRKAVRAVLEAADARFQASFRQSVCARISNIRQLQNDLAPLLDADQMEHLKKRLAPPLHGGFNHHPDGGPPGPPPGGPEFSPEDCEEITKG